MSYNLTSQKYGTTPAGRQAVELHRPTAVAIPKWSRQPTTTLTTANIRFAMERMMEIITMRIEERNLLSVLSDRQVVPQGSEFIRMHYDFSGAFEPRPEHGSFPILTVNETPDHFTLNGMGLGMRLSIEAIRQDPKRVAVYAYALSERMVEAELYAILTALLQIEQYRLSLLEDGQHIQMLSSIYGMMAMNKISAERRGRMVSIASTFLSQAPQNIFLPPNMETTTGSPDGPRVIAVRGGLNPENLRSALEEQLRMAEYFNFPTFMNTHKHRHISDRDIEVYDHRKNTRAKLSFQKFANKAAKDFLKVKPNGTDLKEMGLQDTPKWNDYDWFNKDPRVKQLYGRAKLNAAGLPDKSVAFVFLLALAKDKPSSSTDTAWKYATETAVKEGNTIVGDKEKRMVRLGEAQWNTLYKAFETQNKLNEKLGGGVSALFDNVLTGLNDSDWEIDRVAGYIGGFDRLNGDGIDELLNAGVSLPIDLIAVRHKMEFAFSTAVMHTGTPAVTVYTTEPIVTVGDDVTTATAVANIAFSNNGIAKQYAHTNVMTIRGAILNRHVSGGGVEDTEIIAVAVPPGTLMPDIFPLTTNCAMLLTGEKVQNPYIKAAFGALETYNAGSMDTTRMLLSESAVRTGCTYKNENGDTVVDVNPNAPAHLIAHLPHVY